MDLATFINGGGKINVTLLPNGIHTDEKGNISCGFSVMFGLVTSIDQTNMKNPLELVIQVADRINRDFQFYNFNFQFSKLPIGITTISGDQIFKSEWGDRVIFNKHHKELWTRLLEEVDKFSILAKPVNSTRVLKKHAELFPKPILASLKHVVDPLRSLATLIDKVSTGSSVDNDIIDRQYIYESIGKKGYINAASSKAEKKTQAQQPDLLRILSGIYQHPFMAGYFGLFYHFNVPFKKGTDTHFRDTYFREESVGEGATGAKIDIAIDFTHTLNPTDYSLPPDTTSGNTMSFYTRKIKTVHGLNTTDDNGGYKYFHGACNYGILDPATDIGPYVFSTLTADNKLQTDKIYQDQLTLARRERNKLKTSQLKPYPVTGIYLFTQPKDGIDVNVAKDTNFLRSIGHSVATIITGYNEKNSEEQKLFSLCSRKAVYSVKHTCAEVETDEEGWIHLNLWHDGINKTYASQTLFHWTGHNLCVQPMGYHDDQKHGKNDEQQGAGLTGVYENTEGDIQKNHGFTFKHKLLPGADAQLIADKKYSFVIKKVLSNGSTLEIDTAKRIEKRDQICMQDLVSRSLIDNYILPFSPSCPPGSLKSANTLEPFSVDTVPVNSPSLVLLHPVNSHAKSPETASHIAYYSEQNNEVRRYLFPPVISRVFAQYLGVLAPYRIAAGQHAQHNYIKMGKKVFDFSYNKMPNLTTNKRVQYLADIRAKHVAIMPADWQTLSLMKGKFTNFVDSFIYDKDGFAYDRTTAKDVIIKSGGITNVTKVNGSIVIEIPEGNTCKFLMSTWENLPPVKPPAKLEIGSIGKSYVKQQTQPEQKKDKTLQTLLDIHTHISEYQSPVNPNSEFQVVHAVKKPVAPTLPNSITGSRPTKATDLDKVFYSFNIPGYNSYTVSKFEVVSNYTVMQDDGQTRPSANKYTTKEDVSKLLIHEHPSDIFNQVNTDIIEPEVFKNDFGVSFNFDNLLADILSNHLLDNQEIFTLNIGTGFNMSLSVISPLVYQVILYEKNDKDNPFAAIPIHNINDVNTVSVLYSITSASPAITETELCLSVTYNGTLYGTYPIATLPHTDLNAQNLTLLPVVEQIIISAPVTKTPKFNFVFKQAYFVYRTEASAKFIPKTIQLRGFSRFSDYYNSNPKENLEFYSDRSKVCNLTIPNNAKPAEPVFKITPLIYTTSEHEAGTRSMQLMLEFDRPFYTGEKIGIVINNILAPPANVEPYQIHISGIGRDITTFKNADTFNLLPFYFEQQPKVTPHLITGAEDYLAKYLYSESELQKYDDNGTYEFYILNPYYEAKKDKWIAIIAFNQKCLAQDQLYNPFVKIVACKFQPAYQATPTNVLSKFTKPKFINLLSRRSVDVKLLSKYTTITVGQDESAKIDNSSPGNPMAFFIVALRYHSINGIHGPLMEVTLANGKKQPFIQLPINTTVSIERPINSVLCVYEFEKFTNINNEEPNIDSSFLEDPRFRLIFAEEF